MVDSTELSEEEKEFFKHILLKKMESIDSITEDMIHSMKESNLSFADPFDRANYESERNRTLRMRDRERKLLSKIQKALQRIEDGIYNECIDCGEAIGVERLKARPVTNQCVQCKEIEEQEERVRKV